MRERKALYTIDCMQVNIVVTFLYGYLICLECLLFSCTCSFVQAQFWHDPFDEENYRENNMFLSDINQENVSTKSHILHVSLVYQVRNMWLYLICVYVIL